MQTIKVTHAELSALVTAKAANGGKFGVSFDFGRYLSKPAVSAILAARIKGQPFKFVA